ncbi:MAG: glycerol-3-phosphate 1-O-acyltransferase PlsY [Lachnospirales bacterium]
MIRLILLLIGYSIGCIQSAYIVGKIHGIDIREHGSGNAGTTNIMRTIGKKAGVLVFLLDFFKCFLVTSLVIYIFRADAYASYLYGIYAGAGVMIGHNFAFYLKFKGGKGIACGMGLIVALNFWLGLGICIAGITIVAITKYMSLGSLISAFVVPFAFYISGVRGELFILTICLAILAIYQHRGNIVRLVNGTENKFSVKKQL